MAKKPKKQWQIDVRGKLEQMGMGYLELSEKTGLNEGTIRQVMCKDNVPGVRQKICDYLGVEITDQKAS